VAGLRCASCGAEVSPFAARCDRCGADPEVTVVELGGGGGRRGAGTPRRGGRRALLPILAAVAMAWAIFAIVGALGGDDETASDAPGAASETTGVSIRLPRATTTTIVAALPDAPTLGEPTGLHLLADTPGAQLDVDLDTGVVERHELELGGRVVDGDERGVLVISGRDLVWHPLPFGSAAVVLESDVRDAWLLEDADAVWAPSPGEYALLALDGSGVRASTPVPPEAYPVGVSGDLLVVAGLGRVFTIDAAGTATDLGSGVPVAAGHGFVVIDRCDADLTCGSVRVDLATGEARPLLEPPDGSVITGWWVGPGGRAVFAAFGEAGAGLFVAEEESVMGLVEPGGSDSEGFTNVSFSPDGRWIVASGNGSILLGTADRPAQVRVLLGRFADGVTLLVPGAG